MITSEKKFGYYIRKKIEISSIASTPIITKSECSLCAISSEWIDLPLLSIDKYNHDTSIFTFQLPDNKQYLNLPLGGFLLILGINCDMDGNDGIRPYTNIADDYIDNKDKTTGVFKILCKRYDEWGIKESIQTHFLFTKTNHSYKPPGSVSNYIHKLKVNDTLKFKFDSYCYGKLYGDDTLLNTKQLMMLAVGVGIAPMIQILRKIFNLIEYKKHMIEYNNKHNNNDIDKQNESLLASNDSDFSYRLNDYNEHIKFQNINEIVLLYGVRTVSDILLKDILDNWQDKYPMIFKVIYCIGSRWTNIHWGAKSKTEYVPPPLPIEFNTLKYAELGWVNEEKILKYGFIPSNHMKVLVCGLPGVYDKLCGHRDINQLSLNSILYKLGYSDNMVIKL